MKRLFMLLIIMLFGFSLIGCNGDEAKNKLNRETLKLNLQSYVNEIKKTDSIKINISIANKVINDKVDEINEIEYSENSNQIINEIKGEINSLILDKEVEETVKNNWKSKYETNFYYTEFYGKYDNAYIFFVEEDTFAKKDVIISNVIFRYNIGWEIYVWSNNEFYTLSDSYTKKIIDLIKLEKIGTIHYYKTASKWPAEEDFIKENYFNLKIERYSDDEMEEILTQFDLTDPKIIWEGSIDIDFTDNIIILTLRKSFSYPELELKHFELSNALKVEYVGGARPPEYFFMPGYEHLLENYNQIVFIYINPEGKESVIKSIRKLEKLAFVRSATPNYILSYD